MSKQAFTQRQFLQSTAYGAGIAALSQSAYGATRRKPNILIILTDDQGWGDLGSHGNAQLGTPTLDRFASEGARFDRFYVSPVCAPTRASLLTGRYHLRCGVSGVTHRKEVMRAEEVTLAEILQKGGYATGCFGKWHNGAHYPHHPSGQGFQEFMGFCAGHWNNYFDAALEHNGKAITSKGYINDALTDGAIDFMTRHAQQPFFCYLPFNTPHAPFQVPDKYFNKYKARGMDEALASVYGMCENIDDNMARLLDTLDKLKLTEDTIVIYFGDNGPNTDRYNGGMRGRKGSVYEGGVRNMCLMRWPKHIQAGLTIPQNAAHIDLLPTLATLTGVGMPPKLKVDGRDLSPLLKDLKTEWPDRLIFSCWGRRGSVRTNQYCLVLDRKEIVLLFDMKADPEQKKNILQEKPQLAKKLKTAYEAWYAEVSQNGLEAPPSPIGYDEMPVVELSAPEALLEGGVQFKGEKGWANDWVSHWTSLEGRVSWEVDVVKAAEYEFTLRYCCPKTDVGATVCVEVEGQRVEAVISQAHDPEHLPTHDRVPRWEVYEKEWATLKVGKLALPRGATTLTVRALSKPGATVMELKALSVKRLP